MYIEGKDELMVLMEAMTAKIENDRLILKESPIPVPGTLGQEIHDTRMKSLSIATEIYQRAVMQYDRIKHQTTER